MLTNAPRQNEDKVEVFFLRPLFRWTLGKLMISIDRAVPMPEELKVSGTLMPRQRLSKPEKPEWHSY